MYDPAEQKILDGFKQAIIQAEHKYDLRVKDIEERLLMLEQQFGILMARLDLYKMFSKREDE